MFVLFVFTLRSSTFAQLVLVAPTGDHKYFVGPFCFGTSSALAYTKPNYVQHNQKVARRRSQREAEVYLFRFAPGQKKNFLAGFVCIEQFGQKVNGLCAHHVVGTKNERTYICSFVGIFPSRESRFLLSHSVGSFFCGFLLAIAVKNHDVPTSERRRVVTSLTRSL